MDRVLNLRQVKLAAIIYVQLLNISILPLISLIFSILYIFYLFFWAERFFFQLKNLLLRSERETLGNFLKID